MATTGAEDKSETSEAPAEKPAKARKAKKPRKPKLVLPRLGALPLSAPFAYAGAALSGLLYWLGFAGWDVWPLAFVALVPLLVALQRQTARRALLLGLVSGTTMNVAGFYWLQGMLQKFSGFPGWLCFLFVLIVCVYQGGRFALFGWLYGRAAARGWPMVLVLFASFAASELVYPLLFPWYFAASVHGVPLLTQTAELGGPILVGLVLVSANLAIAEPLLARLEWRKLDVRRTAGAAGAVVVALLFGASRVAAVDATVASKEAIKVGVVQANMGLTEKRHELNEGLKRHLALTDQLRQDGVDFVVWSETSVMSAVPEKSLSPIIQANVSRMLGLPAIFGAVVYGPAPDYVLKVFGIELERRQNFGELAFYNTALSSDASGRVNGRYDKEYLLAFGEYIPFGELFPALYKASPNSGHFSSGTKLDPLIISLRGQDHPVTMLICYEDILPAFTNKAVAYGNPELLVNMTNDAWFGDTTEPWEHLALAQFRAIEHRRFLIRGTNSGVSAIIDPVGRVEAHSSPFKEETLTGTIRWMKSSTVYEAIGDAPFWLLTLAVAAGAFIKRRERAAVGA